MVADFVHAWACHKYYPGFKSYPVRTTITGWDASFNSITGLNGSGKSNILDAICFVLGITNMQQVRCFATVVRQDNQIIQHVLAQIFLDASAEPTGLNL